MTTVFSEITKLSILVGLLTSCSGSAGTNGTDANGGARATFDAGSSSDASRGGPGKGDGGGSRDGDADSTTDSAPFDAIADAGCDFPQTTAPAAQYAYHSTPPPTPMGGELAGGTYYLTSESFYSPCLGPNSGTGVYHATWVVSPSSATAGVIEYLTTSSLPPPSGIEPYTISGSELELLPDICVEGGAAGSGSFSFTATSSEIELIVRNQTADCEDGGDTSATLVIVYTKQ